MDPIKDQKRSPIAPCVELVCGLCVLTALVARTHGTRNAYWRWRTHTAMGDRPVLTLGQRVRGVGAYARWMWRMRRLAR